MSWEKLKELAGSDSDVLGFIESQQESSDALVTKVNTLETTNNGLLGELKRFKQGNSLIKDSLGLEEVNPDSITEALNGLKNAKGDEKLIKELENYKNQLAQKDEAFNSEKTGLIGQIRELKNGSKLMDAISKSGIINDGSAREDVALIVKNMQSYDENDNVIFKNEDGTTRFNQNNQSFTIDDAIASVLESRPYLKAGDIKAGSGAKESNNGSNVGNIQNPVDTYKEMGFK